MGNFGQDEGDELQITVGGTEFRFVASDPSAIPVDDNPIFFHSTGSSVATYLDSLVTQINAASIGVTAADGSSFLSLTASDAGINGNNISVDTGSGTTFSDVLTLEGGTDTVTSADGDGPSVLLVSQSVQSFVNQSPDVEVEVTNMVNMWLQGQVENYGMLIRFSGSQETDETTFGHLKFFSRNTHTIYSPQLEVRWDDHVPCTGDNTGSLNQLVVSGLEDNFLFMKGLREEYKVGERVKFRVGARKRYIQKSFTTSVQTVTGSFIPEGSGSYAIKDVATDEFIVPFSDFTKLSCDSDSNYFIQYLDGFYPDRVYKIQLKLKYDDGQAQVFDDDFEFIVKRK